MATRRKRSSVEGARVRKLDPELRVIANGGRTVNQIRSERSAAVRIRELDPSLAHLREPDDAPAPSDLVEHLPRKAWEAPERGSEDVVVDLFLTLSDAKARRGKTPWKGARITRTRDNLVTVEAPLASLPGIAGDEKVNAIEIAERVDFSPPLNLRIADAADEPGERIQTSVVHGGGRGVLIGIVDVGGFDFAHPDFMTSEGGPRFHVIWDQAGSTRPLPGVDYRWQDDAGFGVIDPDLCLREVAALNQKADRTLGPR